MVHRVLPARRRRTQGLRAPDPAPASEALEQLIDLARETKNLDYIRSEDPMEAARFVLSDAAALLGGASAMVEAAEGQAPGSAYGRREADDDRRLTVDAWS